MPHTDVQRAAEAILDGVVDAYTAAGLTAPSRRFYAAGNVSDGECDFLAVCFKQLSNGHPGALSSAPDRCQAPRAVTFEVVVSRCAQMFFEEAGGYRMDDPSDYESVADEIMADEWVIHLGLAQRIRQGHVAGLEPDDVVIGPSPTLGPFADRLRATSSVTVLLGFAQAVS